MAGDHKCPVCQATFTRPQHVARHMRSHTGDRPYRCQHCGDQFARSDLLSRHVNKCHPGEKPLSSAPTRRKGSSSLSRATTSKQACDQCVQSSLPCDGANPCSKCIHRKCRCTYVKFHRQTAPVGPGHPSRPNDPNAAALAAAAAAGATLPGVNALPILSGLPAIPPSYRLSDSFLLAPSAPAALAAGGNPNPLYANHQFNFSSPSVNGSGANSAFGGDDYASRYRAQAEFLSRAGVLNGSSARAPDGYPQDLPHDGRYAAPYPREIPQSVDLGFDEKQPVYPRDDDPHYGSLPNGYGGYQANAIYQNYGLDQRRPSTGDSQSTGAIGSLPSSASSSSVNLPLPHTHPNYNQQHQRSASSSSSYSDSQTRPGEGYPADGEGGFSSAFGLMSLDDPAVLAGLSEGVPFFDQEGSNAAGGPTWNDGITPRPGGNPGALGERPEREPAPRPEKPGQQTPSTLRELKDMWKTYMRTPLTGPPLAHSVSDAEANPNNFSPTRSPKRDRGDRTIPRVASLPSVKTPDIHAPASWDHIRIGAGNAAGQAGRGSINNPDDLRSYEQAVLARKAPLTLNLVPKRRMGSVNQTQFQQGAQIGASVSRPSSSSSSSSLAQAVVDRTSESPSPVPLLHPAYPTHHSATMTDDARPGFKRLPSQTLGPEFSKRTAVALPLHHNTTALEDDESGTEAMPHGDNRYPPFMNGTVEGLRIADRARRMSAPSVHGA